MSFYPGYEYDIFISYRQNDNKSGWVTKFVKYLNQELAATIKEPVTVYFDSNPHDGLLEIHQVNKSLENKLKCLIFIPILSQTYCDPKSYAWQHEFCAFHSAAQQDELGRDIKLRNGNVVSRILPIRIHDLEKSDLDLLENEIGPLRAIDFIFRSPGVNRPLRSSEEHPNDNLNKTFYRDQINKTANAIKEILMAIKYPDQRAHSVALNPPKVSGKRKSIVAATLIVLLILAGYSITTWIPRLTQASPDKSIAVLYFENMSGDSNQDYFSDGITEEIITNISKLKDLRVISRNSVKVYKGQVLSIKQIAEELNVSSILEGSVRKSGNRVRITAQLIDANTDEHVWAETFEEELHDIFDVQTKIALEIVKQLRIKMAPEEMTEIQAIPTHSKEAYDLYLRGKYELDKRTQVAFDEAVSLFDAAIQLDSTFVLAYSGLADAYLLYVGRGLGNPNLYMPLAKENIDRALYLDPNSAEIQASYGYWHFNNFNFKEAEAYYRKAIALNPNQDNAYNWLGTLLMTNGNFSKAIEVLDAGIVYNPTFRLLRGNKRTALLELQGNQLNVDSLFADSDYQRSVVYWNLGNRTKAIEIAENRSFHDLLQFYTTGSNQLLLNDVTRFIRETTEKGDYLSPALVAGNYGLAGDLENFIEYTQRAIKEKDPVVTTLLNNYRFSFLLPKNDPRVETLQAQIQSLIRYE